MSSDALPVTVPEPPAAPATPPAPAQASSPASILPAPEPPANLLQKIVRAIDRALTAEPKREGWALTAYMILQSIGGQRQLVNNSILADLAKWQQQHEKLIKFINEHTLDDARAAWEAHQIELAKSIHSETIGEETGFALSDFENDFQIKADAAKADLRRVYEEAYPLCAYLGTEFVKLAEKRINDLEQADKFKHDYFGIPYAGPNNILIYFRKAVATAKARTIKQPQGNTSPRELVPYLTF